MAYGSGMVSGVLNIDKPPGWTSHDVVAQVRRLVGQRQVGHAGTLDPMATGVLVVCLGQATRLSEYLGGATKSYRATIRLGVVTDTWDADVRILEKRPVEGMGQEALLAALVQFTGRIWQTPPMFSAIKQHGQPLHRLARQGITVEREPRQVEISRLELLAWYPPDAEVELDCSKGTYVRSLAHDLGQAVGTGATLASLQRTAVGPFRLADAQPLDRLWAERDQRSWQQRMLSMADAVADWPCVTVDDAVARALGHGQQVEIAAGALVPPVAAFDAQHRLVALIEPSDCPNGWKPAKVFVSDGTP